MAEKDDKDDKDEAEDLVVVTDDARNLDAELGDDNVLPGTKDKSKAKQDADDKEAADRDEDADEDDDGDDDEEEARLGKSEEQEDEDEAKAKKKSDHKSRRQRRKAAEQTLRRERDFLEKRNDQLERQLQAVAQGQQLILKRQDENELRGLDKEIASHEATIRKAERVIAEAITNQKGDEAAEATRIRDGLRDELKEMKARREAADKEDEAEAKRAERPGPDPVAVKLVKKWHKDNTWFDFNRRDTDSKIAGAIDDGLMAEGFDPTEQEYFDEFNKRIAKHLPHRALKKLKANGKDRDDDADEDLDEEDEDQDEGVSRRTKPKAKANGKETKGRAPSGGPKFRTGNGRDLKPNEVFLSRDRVEAMKELGVWDDPKLRAKYLQKYRDYDREHNNT
jgi:hypothetical protein